MEARHGNACYNLRTWEMDKFKIIFGYIVSSKSAWSPCDLNSFVFVSETKVKQNKNLSPVVGTELTVNIYKA